MAKIAVFASGRGSNFRAIHDYQKMHPQHEIVCLVTDQADCLALEYAHGENIPVITLNYKGRKREEIETELLEKMDAQKPDYLVFAGFMRIVTKVLVDAYTNRIINLHPSLLPKYPGTHGIEESYASSDKNVGITIHFVDYGMDTGPIILQESFVRSMSESLDEFVNKIHELEHKVFPETIWNVLDNFEKEVVK